MAAFCSIAFAIETGSMKTGALWLLFLLTLLLSRAEAVTRSERGALKVLYWATDGPGWKNSWAPFIQNEVSDPCQDFVS